MRKAIQKLLLVLNILAVIALVSSYIFTYIPPDQIWMASVFALAYPFLLWANIIFIVCWVIFKPRYLILSVAAILLGFGYIPKYLQWNKKTSDKSGTSVLTYNVRHFEELGNNVARETADSIIALLQRNNPDIICLQEVRLRTHKIFDLPGLVSRLDFVEHYQYARTAYYGGIVTMTRYPIVNMGEIRFENSGNMAIFTDVIIDSDTVRIFNVHLQSFQINPDDYSVLESPKLTESSDFREMREMGGKFKRASVMRAEQARIINENISWSPYPVVVCGDFNDTPFSYTYRKVRGNLKDAFIESGKGLGHTYIGKLPSYRIDFIFHSSLFNAYNYSHEDVHYSDHVPVSCKLIKK